MMPSSSHTPNSWSTGTPWFAISMGLLGVIVGYGLSSTQGNFLARTNDQVPIPPSAPTAPSVPEEPTKPTGEVQAVDPESDHIRGNPDADISIIEYSDFQCPFCQRHEPTLVQLLKEHGDAINLAYRHFPLPFHPEAQNAAEASECAAELGGEDAFWSYHDKLFENQGTLGSALYLQLAKDLGLNETAFKTCLDSDRHLEKIRSQMDSGTAVGVTGTPGNIVINWENPDAAELISGAYPVERFNQAIENVRQ